MQLPFEKAKNWHDTIAALEEGKVVIALMGATSLFTDSQHFIVLTGFNEEGKIMVNDPLESNYDKWDIRKGLRTGFDKEAILLGYSGAWIYDKSAMPEEPFLYSEPLPVRGEPRYNFELTWEEIQLLAKVVWVEARGECDEHSVIRYSNGVRTDYENGTQVVKYSNGEGALNINGSTLEWHETMEQSSGVFQSFIRTDSYQNPYNSNNGGSNQSGSNSGGQTSDEAIYELVLDAFKREIRTSHGYTGAAVIYHGATASNKSLTYNSSTNTYKCEMIASYWTNIFDIWGTSKEDYYVSAEIKSLNGNWVVTAITLG